MKMTSVPGSSVGSPSSPTRATWPLLPWRPSASRPERWGPSPSTEAFWGLIKNQNSVRYWCVKQMCADYIAWHFRVRVSNLIRTSWIFFTNLLNRWSVCWKWRPSSASWPQSVKKKQPLNVFYGELPPTHSCLGFVVVLHSSLRFWMRWTRTAGFLWRSCRWTEGWRPTGYWCSCKRTSSAWLWVRTCTHAADAFIPDCAELNQTKQIHLFRRTQFPGNLTVTAFASLLCQIIK